VFVVVLLSGCGFIVLFTGCQIPRICEGRVRERIDVVVEEEKVRREEESLWGS